MTTIKRFTPDYKMHAVRFEAFAREAEHGELVQFDAHQQVVSAVESERDALAVENQVLKTAHPQPFGREMMKALDAYEKHQDEVPETGMLDAFFILRDSVRVETPATDAALAAIRNEATARALKHLCDCQLISSTVAELKTDELREAK
ncbi:hypothetical protein [Serratia marcescens]|uniref:hypothetical protein n=1 Tax=Serratia marcescens TaxID=615 RepID=UPI0036F7D4B0